MKVSKVRISNILGIEELSFEPSPTGLTVIAGPNRTGKTSTLSAIAAALKDRGAHEASLLRAGATEGEVVLVLDDGTEVKKRVTGLGSALTVRKPEVGRVSRPGAILDGLLQVESFDMVGFVRDSAARRVEALARAFPVELPAWFSALAKGIPGAEYVLQSSAHPLAKIAAVERSIFDERTGVNRLAEDKRRTVRELTASAVGDARSISSVEDEIRDVEAMRKDALDLRKSVVGTLVSERAAKVQDLADGEARELSEAPKPMEAIEALNAATDECRVIREEIAVLQERLKAADEKAKRLVQEVVSAQAAILKGIRDEYVLRRTAVEDEYRMKVADADKAGEVEQVGLSARLAALRDELKEAQKAASVRALVEKTSREAGEVEARAKAMTEALERVRSAREAILGEIPVPGVAVVDGEVTVGGIPFPRLSGAEKISLAFAIAVRRAGPLKLAICDGIEQLDSEQFATLESLVDKSGMQLIVSKVSDESFHIETKQDR